MKNRIIVTLLMVFLLTGTVTAGPHGQDTDREQTICGKMLRAIELVVNDWLGLEINIVDDQPDNEPPCLDDGRGPNADENRFGEPVDAQEGSWTEEL